MCYLEYRISVFISLFIMFIAISVCNGTVLSSVTIEKSEVYFQEWIHLGLTWSTEGGLVVYYNGKPFTTTATTKVSVITPLQTREKNQMKKR